MLLTNANDMHTCFELAWQKNSQYIWMKHWFRDHSIHKEKVTQAGDFYFCVVR